MADLLSNAEFWALPILERERIVHWLEDECLVACDVLGIVDLPVEGVVTVRLAVFDDDGLPRLNDDGDDVATFTVRVTTKRPPPLPRWLMLECSR